MAANNGFLNFSTFGKEFVETTYIAITTQSVVYLNSTLNLTCIIEVKKCLDLYRGLELCTTELPNYHLSFVSQLEVSYQLPIGSLCKP